jgi:hypothetical protein
MWKATLPVGAMLIGTALNQITRQFSWFWIIVLLVGLGFAAWSAWDIARPKISPLRYGASPDGRREGLYLTNRGHVARDVRISRIHLKESWFLHFDSIPALEADGFCVATVSRGDSVITTLDQAWLRWANLVNTIPGERAVVGIATEFPFAITSRTLLGVWHERKCVLERDTRQPSGFSVRLR